jgi:excinuclease ABC subunit A
LLQALERLRDLGNTIVLVEHDLATIRRADHVIELGPAAGEHGGAVVASGTPAQIAASSCWTGRYLAGQLQLPRPAQRRSGGDKLRLLGACTHNLREVDLELPLATLTAVSGVSGSGKSSLIIDTLAPAVSARLAGQPDCGGYRQLELPRSLVRSQLLSQHLAFHHARSCLLSLLAIFDPIRNLFRGTRLARTRGYTAGAFSFNSRQGQCATCKGRGEQQIEMHFLSDVWLTCPACHGRRYKEAVLDVRWHGRTIADILTLTVDEARTVFADIARVARTLALVADVGLGYLRLGQSLDRLSGGESQRLYLARELDDQRTQRMPTLYCLDEPTTGLHLEDIRKLLHVLQRLVDAGHSVVVIEHQPDVIATADWVIELGPGAGADGGRITATGTPELLATLPESPTGNVLGTLLAAC